MILLLLQGADKMLEGEDSTFKSLDALLDLFGEFGEGTGTMLVIAAPCSDPPNKLVPIFQNYCMDLVREHDNPANRCCTSAVMFKLWLNFTVERHVSMQWTKDLLLHASCMELLQRQILGQTSQNNILYEAFFYLLTGWACTRTLHRSMSWTLSSGAGCFSRLLQRHVYNLCSITHSDHRFT